MSDRTDNIRITCPHCKVVLETDSNIEGTHVECPECGKEFVAHRDNPTIVDSVKPHSKKKRFIGIVLLVVALFFLLGKCSREQSTSSGNKDAIKAQFVRIVNEQLASQGGKFDVTWDDDAIVISFLQDDLTTLVGFAALETEPFMSTWNTLIFTLLEKSSEIRNTLISKGFEDHIMFNILDADNLSEPLLIILDGTVIYDATRP